MASPALDPDTADDLLIAYALGALEPDEMRQIAELLRAQPELRQRLAEFQQVATALPQGLPIAEPAPALRARVIARVTDAEARPERAFANPPWRGWLRTNWLVALSGALAAVLLALTIALQQQQINQQQQQLVAQQEQLVQRQQLVALLTQPGAALVVAEAADGSATFVRTPGSGAAVVLQLPPLPANRTYQVWLLSGDQSPPSSAGTLAVDASGSGVLFVPQEQPTRSAAAFAITNEPSGGSSGPTTPVLLSGTLVTS